MTMQNDLQHAINVIQSVKVQLTQTPETSAIVELIKACEHLDEYYKRMCDDMDLDSDDPEGTTYQEGISIEFYIEADLWHDVSVQLRKLRELKPAE